MIDIWLALLLSSGTAQSDAKLVEYGCAVMARENGETVMHKTPGLHIIDYNKSFQFAGFQADGETQVAAILCERSSVIPAEFDYQVLLAGLPFFIKGGERTAVLERSNGKYRLRLVKGNPFSEEEEKTVAARLESYPLKSDMPPPGKDLPTYENPGMKINSPFETIGERTDKIKTPECESGHEKAFANGVLAIKPGETICLTITMNGKTVVPVAVTETANPESTLVIRFSQKPNQHEATLMLFNPLNKHLRYRANMQRPGKLQDEYTTTCPVLSHRFGIEGWSYDVEVLKLSGFEALSDSNMMECQ